MKVDIYRESAQEVATSLFYLCDRTEEAYQVKANYDFDEAMAKATAETVRDSHPPSSQAHKFWSEVCKEIDAMGVNKNNG